MPTRSSPFFREIADIAPVMIWVAGLDKLCNYFNKTWLEFTGKDLEDEVGDGWTKGVHPEDVEHCLKTFFESFDARSSFAMEYRLRRRDGAYRWILDNGRPIYGADGAFLGYAGSCIDITDKKEAELSLERSERRYGLVMELISEGIWEFNLETGEHFISQSCLPILGEERPDFGSGIGAYLGRSMHPQDRAKAIDAIDRGLDSEGYFDVEFRQRMTSGEYRWIRARGRVLERDTDGKPFHLIGSHSDIDARKRTEIALQESEFFEKSQHDELAWIYTNAPVGLCILDRDMHYRRLNQHLADFVNLPIEAHIGKSIDEMVPTLAPAVRNEAQKVLLTRSVSMHNEATGPMPGSNGEPRTFLFSCHPIFDSRHHISGFGFVIEDITERKQLETKLLRLNAELETKVDERTRELAELNEALAQQVRTDALTGLHNRLAAMEALRIEHSRFERTRQAYSVLMADVDHFKSINDVHGHLAGDDVLRFISRIFAKNLRGHDFIARYGGEEFIFLLPATRLDEASLVAEKIRKAVEEAPHPVVGKVTVSIGAAEASATCIDKEQIIKEADQSLYEAKRRGRNQVVSVVTADE